MSPTTSPLRETPRPPFAPPSASGEGPLELRLTLTDPETVAALRARPEGPARTGFATTALRIGVLALHQAGGRLDGDLLRKEGERLVEALSGSVARALEGERQRILAEFSLDNRDGALTRLVTELGECHGSLGRELGARIEQVVGAFSLDAEGSALARMRRELVEVLETHRRAGDRFQEEVKLALTAMQVRREEVARGTRHGADFEAAVAAFVADEAQRAGDVASHVGHTTGIVRHCKKGDALLELGPESAAPGARVVVEAKEDRGVDLRAALAECDEARKNREAGVGLFVFSRRTAPEGLAALARYGDDVVVVWDAEDPATDVFLRAGLSVARALATRGASHRGEQAADLGALESAIREIERQAGGLDEIATAAQTAESAAQRILRRTRLVRDGLAAQVEALDERLAELRAACGA
jgi:hypothetical protein